MPNNLLPLKREWAAKRCTRQKNLENCDTRVRPCSNSRRKPFNVAQGQQVEAYDRLGMMIRDQLLLRFPRHVRRVLLHSGKLIDPRISDGDTILPVAPPSW
jgi:hypothetical protein